MGIRPCGLIIYKQCLAMTARNTEYMGSEGYELKSVKVLNSEHERQLLNYMRITRKAVGYLINFGPLDKLEWKRFILKEYIPQ